MSIYTKNDWIDAVVAFRYSDGSRLHAGARTLALALFGHACNTMPTCYPQPDRLTALCGLGRSAFYEARQALSDAGLLEVPTRVTKDTPYVLTATRKSAQADFTSPRRRTKSPRRRTQNEIIPLTRDLTHRSHTGGDDDDEDRRTDRAGSETSTEVPPAVPSQPSPPPGDAWRVLVAGYSRSYLAACGGFDVPPGLVGEKHARDVVAEVWANRALIDPVPATMADLTPTLEAIGEAWGAFVPDNRSRPFGLSNLARNGAVLNQLDRVSVKTSAARAASEPVDIAAWTTHP